jgi:hypothetical protein
MPADGVECPSCGSARVRYREHRDDWFCDDCDSRWTVDADNAAAIEPKKPLVFLSYARRDASDLAVQLKSDLEAHGYRVWLDRPEIVAGGEWEHQITDGLRSAQLLVAVLTPSAVRRSTDSTTSDTIDSVCLDEISFARFAQPPTAIVPVMAQACEPPFSIFRLDYVDMCAWRDAEERYQDGLLRLLTAIEAALRGEVTYRTPITALAPWDFAAFLYEKRRDFCGREWLFEEINLWLATHDEPALLITGDPGTGKSALVAELVHRNPGGQVLAYHCCQADVLATVEPSRFVRSMAAMISSQLPEYAARLRDFNVNAALSEEACANDPFSAFESGVLTPLQTLRAPDGEVRYLLIDALDESLPRSLGTGLGGRGTIVDLLSTFTERLPGWLRIVATTRKEPEVLQRLAGLRAREIAAQDSRNVEDVEHYLRQQLQTPDLSQQLTAAGLSLDAAVVTLKTQADGNFLYASQVCTGLRRGVYKLSHLDAIPSGLSVYYQRFFQRQFPNTAVFERVRPILETLIAVDAPISRESLGQVCGIDEQEVAAALRPLGAFVVQGDSGLRVFHKSLTDWLTNPSRMGQDFHLSSARGRSRLADWILTRASKSGTALSLSEKETLLRQLASTGRWEKLYSVLGDFAFVKDIGSSSWAVLYPQLVQAADERQRDQLKDVPTALVRVGRERVSESDMEYCIYMYYRAFAAALGLVNRDATTAPWLVEFLDSAADLISTRMLGHRVMHDNMRVSAYVGHVQQQVADAVQILDRLHVAVPESVRCFNEELQNID